VVELIYKKTILLIRIESPGYGGAPNLKGRPGVFMIDRFDLMLLENPFHLEPFWDYGERG
jgi:hypothetical protein